jgi:hypothetical protein
MIEVDNAPIFHFWCFQETNRSSLEENFLIRMAGGEDSYAEFVSGETFEKGAIRPSSLRLRQHVFMGLLNSRPRKGTNDPVPNWFLR